MNHNVFRQAIVMLACMAFAVTAAHAAERTDPYKGNAEAVTQGATLFVTKACSGCHGAGGGGGMGPPVINDVWVYGSDDATLFDLIKLGSAALHAKGLARKGRESIVGDMPAMGGVASDDEIWKIIAFIRSRQSADK